MPLRSSSLSCLRLSRPLRRRSSVGSALPRGGVPKLRCLFCILTCSGLGSSCPSVFERRHSRARWVSLAVCQGSLLPHWGSVRGAGARQRAGTADVPGRPAGGGASRVRCPGRPRWGCWWRLRLGRRRPLPRRPAEALPSPRPSGPPAAADLPPPRVRRAGTLRWAAPPPRAGRALSRPQPAGRAVRGEGSAPRAQPSCSPHPPRGI